MSQIEKNISVVLPTIGRPEFLDQSIESLLRQNVPFDEIVIFDNSHDQSSRRNSKYSADERIRWEASSTQLPAIQSWNAAVNLARCEFVTIFGDDDIADPIFCEEMRKMIGQAELVLIPYRYIRGDGSLIRQGGIPLSIYSADEFRFERMRSRIGMVIPGFGFRKSTYQHIGGFIDSGLPKYLFSDDILWFQLAQAGGRVLCGQSHAWNYRVHEGQIGRNFKFREFAKSMPIYLNRLEQVLGNSSVYKASVFPPEIGRNGYGEDLMANRLMALLDQKKSARRGRLLSCLWCIGAVVNAPLSHERKMSVMRHLWASMKRWP